MKHLILCILLAATAAGQSTGDYLLQRKTSTGYEPKTITPESGKVLSWDGSGNPTNVSQTEITQENIQSAISDQSAFLNALGGTTAGKALFQLPNPSAITFPRINADNTVSALSAADTRTALGLGTAATTASTAYATAAQGSTADSALQPTDIASGTITPYAGDLDFSGGIGGNIDLSEIVFARSDLNIQINAASSLYNRAYYQAVEYGSSANDITVAHVVSGGGSTASVSVVGRAITVTAGSTCTLATLVAAVNSSPAASALVTASALGTSSALVVDSVAARNLSSPITQDAKGSITIGTSTGDMDTSFLDLTGPGNLWLQDNKALAWRKSETAGGNTIGPYIYYWQNHDAAGAGEWLFNSPGAHAFIGTQRTQFGNNDGTRDTQYFQLVSGLASAGDPLRASRGITMRTYWWDGDSAERSSMGFQAVPTSTSGTGNKVLKFWDDLKVYNEAGDGGIAGTATQTGEFTGTLIGEMHKEGFWNPGIASEFETLTATADVFTQTCSKYRTVQQAKLTLGDTNSLEISGALNGMRGVIYVKQPAAGSKTMALPDGSLRPEPWVLSTDPSAVDRLAWEYDGSNYLWSMTKGYLVGEDADVTDFVSAGRANITDETIIDALTAFVTTLKGAGIWNKMDAIYPFVGGNATSHSKNLVADTYNLTYPVAMTHGDGVTTHGIIGNNSGYALTGINLNTLSRGSNCFIYLYNRNDTPTSGNYWFGGTAGTSWCAAYRFTTGIYLRGLNSNNQGEWDMNGAGNTDPNDFSTDFAWSRTGTNAEAYYSGAFSGSNTNATSAAPNVSFPIMARWNGSAYANASDLNIVTFAIGQGLDATEVGIFRTASDTFQTALGRANP